MTKQYQVEAARRFMTLHHAPGGFLLPNAWDAFSARLLEDAGFLAVGTTSGGLSWSLGYRDGECAPWSEVVAATKRIARVLRIPLSADIESGYAETEQELERHVEEIINAGAVGINLEDQRGGGLRPLDEACARIRSARDAADRTGVPIVINARTDVFHVAMAPEQKFDEAVARAHAYLKAGASSIFIFGQIDMPTIARLVRAIPAPVNVVGRPGGPCFADFSAAGVARVSLAAGISLFAYGAVRDAASRLRAENDFDCLSGSLPRAEAQKLFPDDRL
jgi:2-methylisocitrate lyase-like PEP mutase family enzyme